MFVLIRFSLKSSHMLSTIVGATYKCSAKSAGRTTPLARSMGSVMLQGNGSVIKPVEKQDNRFWMSPSSRLTLFIAASLWTPCSLDCRPYICFSADGIDARSRAVKNHRLRAEGVWDMPTMPPFPLESALIDCSRAMPVQTWMHDHQTWLLHIRLDVLLLGFSYLQDRLATTWHSFGDPLWRSKVT